MATTLETELLRNMALIMEQERARRGVSTVELAQLCDLSQSDYLGILDGSANLRLSAIDRISRTLDIPLIRLFGGPLGRLHHH